MLDQKLMQCSAVLDGDGLKNDPSLRSKRGGFWGSVLWSEVLSALLSRRLLSCLLAMEFWTEATGERARRRPGTRPAVQPAASECLPVSRQLVDALEAPCDFLRGGFPQRGEDLEDALVEFLLLAAQRSPDRFVCGLHHGTVAVGEPSGEHMPLGLYVPERFLVKALTALPDGGAGPCQRQPILDQTKIPGPVPNQQHNDRYVVGAT